MNQNLVPNYKQHCLVGSRAKHFNCVWGALSNLGVSVDLLRFRYVGLIWQCLFCLLSVFGVLGYHENIMILELRGPPKPLLPWGTRRNMKHDWRGTRCPITPTCKTSIVVTATTFTLFKANIQRWSPLAASTLSCMSV